MAKTVAIVLWIFTSINLFRGFSSNIPKYIMCFIPNWGLMFAVDTIFQFERSSKTLDGSQMYENLYGDPVRVGYILLAQIFWTMCYVPITWYIEKIFPGEYGAPLPLYFPFLVSKVSYFEFYKLLS